MKLPETQAQVSHEFLNAKACLIIGASGIPQTSSVIMLCILIEKNLYPLEI